jgi:deazaflavin-dependent oxidoreductase (nitroreductase family)
MDETIRRALKRGLTCDITTIGRKSGRPRRIEIWYFVVDDAVYITGTPGERDWYANLMADPTLTFHVKEGAHADLPARAEPISDPAERRRIMGAIMRGNPWFAAQPYDLEAWVNGSPLIGVIFEGIALHE